MNELYYGNTVLAQIIAGALILLSLVVGKTFYWALRNMCRPMLRNSKRELLGIIIDMIEQPVVFVVTLAITWLITRLYNSLHQRYLVPLVEKTDTSLDDYLLLLWRKGLNTIFWTIGIIVELNNAGYNITPILAGLGIGGLAFALSVQHTFGNILSGLLIYADGHFKVSDRIQIRRERGDIDGVNVNTESGRQRFAVYKFAHDTTATRWNFLSFRRVT